jgi:hypothetical protein
MIRYVIAGVGQNCTTKFDSSDGHYTTCENGAVCNKTTNTCEMPPKSKHRGLLKFQKNLRILHLPIKIVPIPKTLIPKHSILKPFIPKNPIENAPGDIL